LTKGSLRVNVYLVGFKVKTNFQMKNIKKLMEEEKTTLE